MEALPSEVLAVILGLLDDPADSLAFRLVCRATSAVARRELGGDEDVRFTKAALQACAAGLARRQRLRVFTRAAAPAFAPLRAALAAAPRLVVLILRDCGLSTGQCAEVLGAADPPIRVCMHLQFRHASPGANTGAARRARRLAAARAGPERKPRGYE